MVPPIWQEPSAPRLTAYRRPASAAAGGTAARTQPASTSMELLAASTPRTLRMRARLTMTGGDPWASGTAPPHRLVLPPCGRIGTPCATHRRTTAATCGVLDGSTTQAAGPR